MFVNEQKAIELLNNHDIVALPTETVYGLAARFDSEEALKKVFKTKRRPSFDPLIVHISDKSQLSQLASNVSNVESFLMDRFWPGPLTLVLDKHKDVSEIITSGLATVAVRMPKNSAFLNIITHTAPLAAPSANLFGHTSPTQAEHVEMEFSKQVAVLDGGACTVGIESSVMRIEETSDSIDLYILRPGMLTHDEILLALKEYSPKDVRLHFGATAASPGHVEDHYQPRTPLVIARERSLWTSGLHSEICKRLDIAETSNMVSISYSGQDPTLVARILYSDLHRLSAGAYGYIYLTVDDAFFSDDWRGIRDRVQKASKISVTEENGRFFIQHKLENFTP